VWASASNLYYLQVDANTVFATGTPLYVQTYTETDPIYTSDRTNGTLATGTPLYAYSETDPVWTNVRRRGYTQQGPVTNIRTFAINNAANLRFVSGPSRFAMGTNTAADSTTFSSIAIGDNATARNGDGGVAIGYACNADNNGLAIGFRANAAGTNIVIGYKASAPNGRNRIAFGCSVTNYRDDTCVVRGSMYLDGGTGVLYRSTFGSGSWKAKAFTIDHPLDPANKVLRHFCLESPDVWNVYTGSAALTNGLATVALPDYYTALNLVGSEVYSLTAVGEEAAVWVASEVADNEFVIAGSRDIEVSWDIKVLRNDPACLEDLQMRPVEQLKSEIPQ